MEKDHGKGKRETMERGNKENKNETKGLFVPDLREK